MALADPEGVAKYVIGFLNEVVKADPKALHDLIEARVPCNEALTYHPTIQASAVDPDDLSKGYQVGVLGLLNGIIGTIPDSQIGYVTAHFDDPPEGSPKGTLGPLLKFSRSNPEAYNKK